MLIFMIVMRVFWVWWQVRSRGALGLVPSSREPIRSATRAANRCCVRIWPINFLSVNNAQTAVATSCFSRRQCCCCCCCHCYCCSTACAEWSKEKGQWRRYVSAFSSYACGHPSETYGNAARTRLNERRRCLASLRKRNVLCAGKYRGFSNECVAYTCTLRSCRLIRSVENGSTSAEQQ